MEELSVRRLAQEIAARLRERYEVRRQVAEAIVDGVTEDAQGNAVRATATIQGIPKVPVEISYGANIQPGARIIVTNVGTHVAPRWAHTGTAGGIAVSGSGGGASGPAGGDLAGTYPNPTVVRLQGRAVASASPSANQVLTWNATNARWEPGNNDDHGILGAYDIEFGSYSDAGMGDDFNSSTLSAKWTAVGMSAGTVSLTRTAAGNIYDLSTRPGTLLVQVASNGGQAMLRQDAVPSDGQQILISINAAFPQVLTNNAWRCVVGLNDNDTGYEAGNYLYVYLDGSDNTQVKVWDGTLLGNTAELTHGGRIYFRLLRTGGTAYFFVSCDGIAWSFVGSKAWQAGWNNFWVGFASHAAYSGVQPIGGINWVRHVANVSLDPW